MTIKQQILSDSELNYHVPMIVVGCVIPTYQFFIDFLNMQCKEKGIADFAANTEDIFSIMYELKSKEYISKDLDIWLGSKLLYLPDTMAFFGIDLKTSEISKGKSIKRLIIDIRDEFEKLGIMDSNDPSNFVDLHCDTLLINKVEFNELQEEIKNGKE
jgi:hypothetical protein